MLSRHNYRNAKFIALDEFCDQDDYISLFLPAYKLGLKSVGLNYTLFTHKNFIKSGA